MDERAGHSKVSTVFPTTPRECQHCGSLYVPQRSMQRVCGPMCAIKQGKAKKAAAKVALKERKEKLKTRAKWLSEAQTVINKYVRLRDRDLGCCSCDRGPNWNGQWHASHLRSVGAASAIRFHLWNIHKGCSICNNHLSGNVAEYLPRVRARIGDEKVDWLYTQNQLTRHDIPYLTRFKTVMGKRLRRLEKRCSAV